MQLGRFFFFSLQYNYIHFNAITTPVFCTLNSRQLKEERGFIFLGFAFLKIIVCCKTAPAEGLIFTRERGGADGKREGGRWDLPKGKRGLQCLSTLPSPSGPYTYLHLETVPDTKGRTRKQPQPPSSTADRKENQIKQMVVSYSTPEARVISRIKALKLRPAARIAKCS